MQVLNLATGREASVELPAASSVASAPFSPDGSFLVVQVSFSDNTANGARAVQLSEVHGQRPPDGRAADLGHSDALVGFNRPATATFIAEFSFTTKVQLASWRPGQLLLAIVVLRPQHSLASWSSAVLPSLDKAATRSSPELKIAQNLGSLSPRRFSLAPGREGHKWNKSSTATPP